MLTVFFFNDTATTEIYTLSLHDALPIFPGSQSQTVRDEVDKNFARDARATMAAVIVPRRDATRGEIAEAIGRVDRAAGAEPNIALSARTRTDALRRAGPGRTLVLPLTVAVDDQEAIE